MKKVHLTLFTLAAMALLLGRAVAQDATPAPKPLEDGLWSSLVGDWEGWSEDARGRTQDELEIEWELHKQFLRTRVTAKNQNTEYKITGFATKDPTTNAVTSIWFDSFRGVYHGTETREGNKFTLKLDGPAKIERTYELIDNKLVGTYKVVRANGQTVEGKSELTRKVKAPKKS